MELRPHILTINLGIATLMAEYNIYVLLIAKVSNVPYNTMNFLLTLFENIHYVYYIHIIFNNISCLN